MQVQLRAVGVGHWRRLAVHDPQQRQQQQRQCPQRRPPARDGVGRGAEPQPARVPAGQRAPAAGLQRVPAPLLFVVHHHLRDARVVLSLFPAAAAAAVGRAPRRLPRLHGPRRRGGQRQRAQGAHGQLHHVAHQRRQRVRPQPLCLERHGAAEAGRRRGPRHAAAGHPRPARGAGGRAVRRPNGEAACGLSSVQRDVCERRRAPRPRRLQRRRRSAARVLRLSLPGPLQPRRPACVRRGGRPRLPLLRPRRARRPVPKLHRVLRRRRHARRPPPAVHVRQRGAARADQVLLPQRVHHDVGAHAAPKHDGAAAALRAGRRRQLHEPPQSRLPRREHRQVQRRRVLGKHQRVCALPLDDLRDPGRRRRAVSVQRRPARRAPRLL